MKKKTNSKTDNKVLVMFIGIVLVVLAGAYVFVSKYSYYNDAAKQASMTQVRELILMALDNIKKDVPVDAKTGDLYFPESKLYLPNPMSNQRLTYNYSPASEGVSEELSVSLRQVPGVHELYSAKNETELFSLVSNIQACSRGVKLVYDGKSLEEQDQANKLVETIKLDNGKNLLMYVEDKCDNVAFDNLVEMLKNIKSY